MLDTIRIVLVNTSHPGNIGATARAMKVMGFSELYLVDPSLFPDGRAVARASGAEDLLERAVVVSTLEEALEGCELVYGTSARLRRLEQPMVCPSTASEQIVAHTQYKTAILFGRESSGLTNEELALCHRHIVIPTVETFSSLNLAQAVQIICYTLRQALLARGNEPAPTEEARELAGSDQMMSFYAHLQATLIRIKFLNPGQPKMLMQRLQRLFNRASLDKTELNILRGILSRVDKLSE